jgi:hypothetical protein
MQTVIENSLMQHHVALPPDAMGKVTYIAPPGQYSLKVCLSNFFDRLSCAPLLSIIIDKLIIIIIIIIIIIFVNYITIIL